MALLGTCCCGSSSSSSQALQADCCDCPVAPAEWNMTVAGITNGVCPGGCENANGTFKLAYVGVVGGECRWEAVINDFNCFGAAGLDGKWRLTCTGVFGTGYWHLLLMPALGDASIWRKARADWNCLGANTLDLVTDEPECANEPATITITPG